MKIQELQSELARLQELEMQSRNYQQRSEQSLEGELKYHKEKIAELWGKIQDAAMEEVDWVTLIQLLLATKVEFANICAVSHWVYM